MCSAESAVYFFHLLEGGRNTLQRFVACQMLIWVSKSSYDVSCGISKPHLKVDSINPSLLWEGVLIMPLMGFLCGVWDLGIQPTCGVSPPKEFLPCFSSIYISISPCGWYMMHLGYQSWFIPYHPKSFWGWNCSFISSRVCTREREKTNSGGRSYSTYLKRVLLPSSVYQV